MTKPELDIVFDIFDDGNGHLDTTAFFSFIQRRNKRKVLRFHAASPPLPHWSARRVDACSCAAQAYRLGRMTADGREITEGAGTVRYVAPEVHIDDEMEELIVAATDPHMSMLKKVRICLYPGWPWSSSLGRRCTVHLAGLARHAGVCGWWHCWKHRSDGRVSD